MHSSWYFQQKSGCWKCKNWGSHRFPCRSLLLSTTVLNDSTVSANNLLHYKTCVAVVTSVTYTCRYAQPHTYYYYITLCT